MARTIADLAESAAVLPSSPQAASLRLDDQALAVAA